MKTTAATALFLSAAVARIIDGASLATSRGENVKRQTSDEVVLQDYDYVIVGSGAGGSPLAARLAQGGYSVLLLEAGDDQTSSPQYKVPLLHPAAVEHAPMRWDFFVKHYDNETENMRDEKLTYTLPDGTRYTGANPPSGAKPLGILYPRAGTLGGCTSHNALITIYPHDSDWQYIQNITGDATWAPDNMRKYFQKLEHANPDYVARGAPGHGFDGWLQVSNNNATAALQDPGIVGNLNAAMAVSGDDGSYPDANRMGGGRDSAEGLTLIPVAMKQPEFERSGPVDLLRATMNALNADGTRKYKLDIQTNTLVTTLRYNTVTSSKKPLVSGVNFMVGRSLYKADPLYKSTNTAKTGHVTAKREVIISAGTFNTPQILKLSGIGPQDELAKWNITTVVNLPGVGKNMQDRYEAPVITRSEVPLTLTAPCTFLNGTDPCYTQWQGPTPKGPYATNGGVAGYIKKSPWAANNDSDLFISMFPGAYFNGYYPDNVYNITHGADAWTWLPLKAHSRNNAGTVTLTSKDPRDVPDIRFRYFSVGGDEDLNALVDGLKWGRKVMQSIAPSAGTFTEVWPGPSVQTDDQWRTYAKYTAWGHHASCTSPIGAASDPNAVLDTNFKVRGVDGLRVVDASAFPKIPGFYIVTPTYMISEKAADVILAGK